MSRTIPDCPVAPDLKADELPPDTIAKTYTVTVITPLFGGGAEAGMNDPATLIRPSSVRGHLRFWWRATRGARFQKIKELRQREGEIWGTAENPSPVKIQVDPPQWSLKREPGNDYGFPPYGAEAYALFSAKQNGNELCKEGLSFSLSLRWLTPTKLQALRHQENEQRRKTNKPLLPEKIQDISLDIQAATWAWVNFGGVGARTRRGCGALYCQEFAPLSASKIEDWLENARNAYELLTDRQVCAWPILTTSPLVMRTPLSPVEAWHEAVGLIREFRQGVGVGRNSGRSQNQPGRSRWPEPDSLRAITGKGDLRHSTSITLADLKNAPAFPRAELGLPIVFHFKDSADSPNNSELYPKGKTRMASPIILRPLAVRERSQAVAMVLRLTTPPLGELELKKVTDPPALDASNICRPDLAQYANSPLGSPPSGGSKRSSSGSALDAFIAFAKEKGFQECTP